MKIRTLIICLLASSVLVQPAGAGQKPKPGPVKVDGNSVKLVQKNLGFELADDSIRALTNVALAELIEFKEPEAPDQPIPEQAVFVSHDKKSHLFQMTSYDLIFQRDQTLRVICHGWFRGTTDWTIMVDVIAGRPEDWARVTELYKSLRLDNASFRLVCDGAKLETDNKYHYAFFTVDLSESDRAITLSAPNYLAGLTY
ncbi:hypothetical protein KJ682_13670 [bacterium]|nr:hypothetical protein [bacterium]